MLATILVVVLILALLGAIPRAGAYNADWGPWPGGLIGLVLVVLLILLLMGRL